MKEQADHIVQSLENLMDFDDCANGTKIYVLDEKSMYRRIVGNWYKLVEGIGQEKKESEES